MEQSAREFEGEDLEEALRAAAAALGAAVDTLDFEIVEEGRRGVFGLGARRVRISVESPAGQSVEPAPVVLAATEAERVSDPDARMVAIEHILRLMRLDLTARTIGRREDGIRIELTGRDRNALTRNEGELLSALQFVLNRMGRRAWPQAGHVELACVGYRDERGDSVVELAREVGAVVARTGVTRKLHPMNPFERRLVHVTIGEIPGLTTRSEGDGFLKRIVVERGAESPSQKLES